MTKKSLANITHFHSSINKPQATKQGHNNRQVHNPTTRQNIISSYAFVFLTPLRHLLQSYHHQGQLHFGYYHHNLMPSCIKQLTNLKRRIINKQINNRKN